MERARPTKWPPHAATCPSVAGNEGARERPDRPLPLPQVCPEVSLASINSPQLRSQGLFTSSRRVPAIVSPERLLPHGEHNRLAPSPASSPGRGPPAAATRSSGSRPLLFSVASGKLWRGCKRPHSPGAVPAPFPRRPSPPSAPKWPLTCAPLRLWAPELRRPHGGWTVMAGDMPPCLRLETKILSYRGRGGPGSSSTWYLASKVAHLGGCP